MKKSKFLADLKKDGKLILAEPSEDVCNSCIEKADNCLKSANILLKSVLFENSVTMSYFAMYNSVSAFLFRIGIKCENHAGSILLLKHLSGREDLFKAISFAKRERIDKQYYVSPKNSAPTREATQDMLSNAEEFLVKMKLLIGSIRLEDIDKMRAKLRDMV